MKESITPSCGNVFADLGFSAEETAILTVRAEWLVTLRKLIAERDWTMLPRSAINLVPTKHINTR